MFYRGRIAARNASGAVATPGDLARAVARRVAHILAAAATCACVEAFDGSPRGARVVWRNVSNATTGPVLVDSLAVFGTFDGNVIAHSQATGAIVWSRTLSAEIYGEELSLVAGKIIVPEYELWALNPTTGSTAWRYGGPRGDAGVTDPAASGDTLFLGGATGWAAAVDARTGAELWGTDLGERLFRPSLSTELVIYGTRSIQNGALGAGHVVALRRTDGSEVWRFAIPDSAGFPLSGGALNGGVVWNDRVIVGSRASRVYALRLTDGQLLWEATGASPPSAFYSRRPSMIGETVLFSRGDGLLEARAPASGDLLWTRQFPTPMSYPVVHNGAVYIVAGAMWSLRESGTQVWRWGGEQDGTTLFYGAPAFAESGLLFLWGDETTNQTPTGIAFAFRPPVRP
jgi:outer membrane protein assembly factor BamB